MEGGTVRMPRRSLLATVLALLVVAAACGVDDEALRTARLALCAAVRQTLANGLSLLGVSAPEKM